MATHSGFDVIPTQRKEDPRGALAELVRDIPGGSQLYVFTIASGQSRGGHWHRRKREWFVCVAGEATLTLETDEGRGAMTQVHLRGDFTQVVQVDTGTKHTFQSKNGATIVGCISESFDPTDPDTFFSRQE